MVSLKIRLLAWKELRIKRNLGATTAFSAELRNQEQPGATECQRQLLNPAVVHSLTKTEWDQRGRGGISRRCNHPSDDNEGSNLDSGQIMNQFYLHKWKHHLKRLRQQSNQSNQRTSSTGNQRKNDHLWKHKGRCSKLVIESVTEISRLFIKHFLFKHISSISHMPGARHIKTSKTYLVPILKVGKTRII